MGELYHFVTLRFMYAFGDQHFLVTLFRVLPYGSLFSPTWNLGLLLGVS